MLSSSNLSKNEWILVMRCQVYWDNGFFSNSINFEIESTMPAVVGSWVTTAMHSKMKKLSTLPWGQETSMHAYEAWQPWHRQHSQLDQGPAVVLQRLQTSNEWPQELPVLPRPCNWRDNSPHYAKMLKWSNISLKKGPVGETSLQP